MHALTHLCFYLGGDDGGDGPAEVPQILGQSVAEKEKRDLHDKGKTLHDEFEAPSNHPPHPELPVAAAVDERSFDVEIEPLFPKHGQECGEQCTGERAEQDGLDLDRRGLWAWRHRDTELVLNTRSGVEQHGQDGEAHLVVIRT